MFSETILACGNCVYFAMWHQFPPMASWVLIIPGWFLVLSAIRTWTGQKLVAIPHIYTAIFLVLAVFFIAPSIIGPPLGFWIPVCCIIGTWVGIHKNWNTTLARTLIAITMVTAISLVAFGALDYRRYDQMPAAEKEKRLPVWEVVKRQRQKAA